MALPPVVCVLRLFDSASGRVPRVSLLGAFLILTLVLAGWLGYEAVQAERSQRQTAEAVLRDYAGVALSSFIREARDDLDDVLDEIFHPIHHDLAGMRSLPSPLELVWDLDDAAREAGCRCRALLDPLALFSADLETGRVRTIPDSVPAARIRALADTIAERRTDIAPYNDGFLTLPGGGLFGAPVAVGYTLARDSVGHTRVMGFVTAVEALEEMFAGWYGEERLLPEPIGGDLPNDSLLHLTVRGPADLVLFRSPVEYPMTLGSSGSLGVENGDLAVEVTMRPDQASQLIIGGLPRSRLPLLFPLLLLTLGVGGAALLQLKREAEFQQLRDDFVSGVSHELRTPLAQIRMFAELQDAGKLASPEDRERAISVIHREARRLSHLVENILQFSRLRYAEGPDMPKEELDLGEALEEGLDAMTPLLRDRSATLRYEAEPGLVVRANRDSLTRIVVNLLDNAVKYGPPGQEVSVEVRRLDGAARLSVQDQGPGIPPADRPRVWKPYRRLERDVKARLPGTGIGLSVVAELTRMHDGRVWVENAPAGGACFVVELPLAASAYGAGDAESGSEADSAGSTTTGSGGRRHRARDGEGSRRGRTGEPDRASVGVAPGGGE